MSITINLPDSIVHHISADADDIRDKLLESFAVEGYRSGSLTSYEVGKLLGLETRMQVDEFLKRHELFLEYSEEELEEQRQAIRQVTGAR